MKSSIVLLFVFAAASHPATAQEIAGRASVIDGDTLEIVGTRIRLFGIDAPESDQTCHDDDGKLYRCGQKAANDLSDFIGAKTVSCEPRATDRCGRTVAVCSVGDVDMAYWLVRQGLAFDWPQYSKGKYTAVQKEAERTGDGMWGGQWVVPWRYRECKQAGGMPAQCSEAAQ